MSRWSRIAATDRPEAYVKRIVLQARAERAAAAGVDLTDDDVLRVIDEPRIGSRPAGAWIGTR